MENHNHQAGYLIFLNIPEKDGCIQLLKHPLSPPHHYKNGQTDNTNKTCLIGQMDELKRLPSLPV